MRCIVFTCSLQLHGTGLTFAVNLPLKVHTAATHTAHLMPLPRFIPPYCPTRRVIPTSPSTAALIAVHIGDPLEGEGGS